MAKITLNPLIRSAQGKMDNAVFRHSHTGEMIPIKLADMLHVKWSKALEAHRQRFKEAIAYEKAAMEVPELRVVYGNAVKKRKRPYELAVSDYFKGRNLLSSKSE